MNPAFAYVYDEVLSDRRYEREMGVLETELARRGIEGRIARLAMFRNPREMADDLMKVGVKNVVLVGRDEMLKKLMAFVPDFEVTLGYLPVGDASVIAKLLGIPTGIGAVDVLAARLIETLDVGKLNDRYFLTEVVAPSTKASIDIEGKYRVSPTEHGAIAVRNLGSATDGGAAADPQDGRLEVVIQARVGSRWWKKGELEETRIWSRYGVIRSTQPIDIFVDGEKLKGTEFNLSIVPKKLRVITGRSRSIPLSE